jgi:Flp pilus assembly pilin Flp
VPLRLRDTRGQAAVEFVTLLPLVVVVLAGAWQAVLAAHAQWSASAAARAAARASAIGLDTLPAARRALPDSLDERVSVDEEDEGVAVHLAVPAILPGLDLGTLTARATFASQR